MLLIRWQAEAILRNYKALQPKTSIVWRIGAPVDAVRDVMSEYWLEKPRGVEASLPAVEVSYGVRFVDDLFTSYLAAAPRGKKKPGYTTLGGAILMFPAGRRPWLPLWEAIFP